MGGCFNERGCFSAKRPWRRCVYHDALERCFNRARPVAGGGCGARKTLPHLLAVGLFVCKTRGTHGRRRAGPHPKLLCPIFGATRFRHGSAGKGATAILFVSFAETLSGERARARSVDQARRRPDAYPIGRA